jgi:hypothetical protein
MATKRNLLEEAIADAKAVKEMAIANAKAALEEAFEPQLKNLFSLKLQEMESDEELDEMKSDEELEEVMDKETMEEVDLEELLAELNEEESEEEESEESEEEENEPIGELTKEELEKMIEDVIAEEFPELLKMKDEEGENEEGEEIEDMDSEEEDVELAEILAEIAAMEDENEMVNEEEDMMKEEEIEEGFMDKIVKAVNRFGSSGAVEDLIKIDLPKVVAAGKKLGKLDPSYEPNEEEINKLTASAKEDGGTGSIKIMGDKVVYIPGSETKGAAQASTFESLQSELEEAYSTIETLRGDLNEVNLLNAKLLYTNKIFKSKNLNEGQKVKVLGSFDKATTVKEVKLVFETLNEGLKVKKDTIKENIGRASKTTNTPTVKKPIVESNEAFLRMQKLAGII